MDPLNCGSCGHDCYGGDCADGICQFEELWTNGAVGGFAQGVTIADDRVVWVSNVGTLSLPTTAASGTEPILHSTNAGTRVAYKNGLIYRTWGTLITTPITADVVDDVMPNEEDGVWGSGQCQYDLAIDEANETYCVDSSMGRVYRYNATFSATQIAIGLDEPFGVAVDDDNFYVGTNSGILAQPKDLTGALLPIFDGDVVAQLMRVGDQLYFGTDQGLYRLDLSSGAAQQLVADVAPISIYVDAQHIWFTSLNDSEVWRVDLDGGNPRTWGIGGGDADVIAGNELFVFVTTDQDGRVARLAK